MRKIRFKDHYRHLLQLIFMICIAPIVSWFFLRTEENITAIDHIEILSPFIILIIVPTLVIHINYYLKSRKLSVLCTPSFIKINDAETEIIIDSSTVEKIEYHLSYSVSEKRLQWLPWDYYRHVVIHLKDGSSLILTSLLLRNDEFDFFNRNDFETEIHRSLFRLA